MKNQYRKSEGKLGKISNMEKRASSAPAANEGSQLILFKLVRCLNEECAARVAIPRIGQTRSKLFFFSRYGLRVVSEDVRERWI